MQQSTNPFVRCKSLNTSTPGMNTSSSPNGFKASQYPDLPADLTQSVHNPNLLKKLQQEHQMAPCLIHAKLVQHVCKAQNCASRLLCEVCINEHLFQFPAHKEHLVPMQNLLDESVLIQLENLAKDELKPFKQLDDRYVSVCSSLHSSFEELKEKILPLIDRAEEKAQQKIKDYFLQPKKPRGWTTLRQEYLTAKEAYLFSSMGMQTDELEKLIEVLNKVKDKQIEEGTELYNIFHVEQMHMDKLISRVQEDLYFFVDTLFYNEKAAVKPVVVKLDPTKLFYDRELKATHKKLLNAMTYMPKLHQLATATESGEIAIWDATTFALMNSVKVHHDPINALIYSPDENLLISGSKDKSIRLIPINEKGIAIDKIEMFKSHTEAIKSLVLLEGEDRFASAGDDADIRIWNFKTKNLDNIINTKNWKPNGDEMVFIRPERWIAAAGSKEVRIYDYVTRELLITQSAMKNMGSLAFMSEKKLLISQYDDDRLMVWKLDSLKKKLKKEKKLSLPMSAEKPIYFRCYENSDVMIVSMGVSKVLVIKISTGEVLKEIETKLVNTTSVKALDGERRILIGDSGSNQLGILQY